MTSLFSIKIRRPSFSLAQQENGIKSIMTSIQQTATTAWTEQIKSRLDWEQDTTGWMLIHTVNSRFARQITVLVTQPQWPANTCFKTASLRMVSGDRHGQRTPPWETNSLMTQRLCMGQQLLFEWQASPSSLWRKRRSIKVQRLSEIVMWMSHIHANVSGFKSHF